MKFKFCGNIDCPEWLITEIIYLTKISTIKLRIICNNLITSFLSTNNIKDIQKTLEEMNFKEYESNIIISVLEFILKNATKFDIDEVILNQELQQLGLPQENADSISKVYKNQKEKLKAVLKNDIFKLNTITALDYKISYILASDRYNYNMSTSKGDDINDDELKESYKLENVEAKVNLLINDNCHYIMNKEILGKLINDLEKGLELIKRNKE